MWWRLACIVVAAALAHEPASAQDSAAQFYKGKQITVIVGSSAGGGYDIYARLLSRHMPKHIPGNPAMVVTNMTGAGSNAAAAHLFNVAPRDGTVIGALQNSAVLDSLLDALLGDTRRLRHDATKFVHLGSATIDHYVCIARADAPVKSFKELLTRELIIGASQPGTSTRDYPAMLNNLTGTKKFLWSAVIPARARSRSRSKRTRSRDCAASAGRASRRNVRTGSNPASSACSSRSTTGATPTSARWASRSPSTSRRRRRIAR